MNLKREVLVITTDKPSEGKISKHLQPVTAHVVAGTNLFNDFFAGMSDIFGGRSGSYKKQLSSIYSEAIERIKQEAKRIGANGVVGLKIDIDEISGGGKSMFMITAIGTAVIIKEKKKEASNGMPQRTSTELSDRVDNERVQRLKQLKALQEKAKNNNFEFTPETWEFIIQNRIKEFFPIVLVKLEVLLNNPTQYMEETVSAFKENTTNYLKSMDLDDQIELIYGGLKSSNTSKKVEEFLNGIIKEDLLLDFEQVNKLLEDDNLNVKKRGMILSTCSRPYYTEQDLNSYKELIQRIETNFPERGQHTTKKQLLSSKEKEVWQCECGKNNEVEITYCTRCGNDLYGFNDREAKPREAIAFINNKISLVKEALGIEEKEETHLM